MRNLSLRLYLTLDGYAEFPVYPGSDHPTNEEPELVANEMWVKDWDSLDTLLFDAETYGQWADFWPAARRTPGEHPWIGQMSRFAESVQKVVLTDSPASLPWRNSRAMSGDVGAAVARLKSEPGKGIACVGGTGLAHELIRGGLIDEYFFAVFPVILGKGRSLFGPLDAQRTLELVDTKRFEYGEIFLHYRARPA
jgi:dihydrofolate reductase